MKKVKVRFLDGTTRDLDVIGVVAAWKSSEISIIEAASCYAVLRNMHPSNVHLAWTYIQSL